MKDVTDSAMDAVVRARAAVNAQSTPDADDTGNQDFNPESQCDCDFTTVTVEDLEQELNFDTNHPGGRRTMQFGPVPYKYGRFEHIPQDYPTSPTIETVFQGLQSVDPDITRDNYSCLATLYEDGSTGIPMHQDDELSIVHDSFIYTVSFGAERKLRISNTIGPQVEYEIPLPHGSVYTMTCASQDTWCHGIYRDPSVDKLQISLTFRKLTTPVPPNQPEPVPQVLANMYNKTTSK